MKMIRLQVFLILIVSSHNLLSYELETLTQATPTRKPKILHLSFHLGCIKEVEYIAKQLDLDLTSWFIFDRPQEDFEGCNSGVLIYNMYPARVDRIWQKHKDYFNQFDIIWTSDTAPLSRIFLQNNWEKPLIIWICNRFDYFHMQKPDEAYYEQFQAATKKDNVWIVSYTPYEWFYAYKKGVYLDTQTINPIGAIEESKRYSNPGWSVPASIDKENTLFIYPRLKPKPLEFIQKKCEDLGIKTYSGRYNGSDDIKDFKGVLFITYEWSNLCLFENFQRGLIHFLPSIDFAERLYHLGAPVSGQRSLITSKLYEFSEWYKKKHQDLIVYYDSWQDLRHKVETTDYAAMKKKIVSFAREHEAVMLNRWREVFTQVYDYCK